MSGRSRLVTTFADEQFGVIAARQLRALGVSNGTVGRWREAGWLRRIHPAVYAVGHEHLRWEGRLMAAALCGGESAAVSDRAATAWYGLRNTLSARIDVTVPAGRKRVAGIRWHRAELPPEELTAHEGIPVTSVARTLLDVSVALDPVDITRMLARADTRGLLDAEAVVAACARVPGHRGRARLLRALDSYVPELARSRSRPEIRGFQLIRAAALKLPSLNAYVETDIGLIEVDLVWRRERVCVEIDSFHTHGSPVEFERDRERDQALLRAAWTPMRVTETAMDAAPQRFVESVAILLSRSS